MKKLLLSSIIMIAVCSVASAQNSDLRLEKNSKKVTTAPTITNAAAAKPQKAAVSKSDEAALKTKEDGTASEKTNDLQAAPATPAATSSDMKADKQKEAVKAAPVKKG